MLSGAGADELAGLLGALVGLLAPPVLSEVMARLFGRQQEWLRYATAFNWSRWAMLLALGVGLMLMATLVSAGLDEPAAVGVGLVAILAYGVVLDVFVARVGLRLAWWQAALVVITVNGACGAAGPGAAPAGRAAGGGCIMTARLGMLCTAPSCSPAGGRTGCC